VEARAGQARLEIEIERREGARRAFPEPKKRRETNALDEECLSTSHTHTHTHPQWLSPPP